jgi:hypothetical protein
VGRLHHDATGWLFYRHRNTACLFIQSKCNELQPPTNIFIWVAGIFDSAAILNTVYSVADSFQQQGQDVNLTK